MTNFKKKLIYLVWGGNTSLLYEDIFIRDNLNINSNMECSDLIGVIYIVIYRVSYIELSEKVAAIYYR